MGYNPGEAPNVSPNHEQATIRSSKKQVKDALRLVVIKARQKGEDVKRKKKAKQQGVEQEDTGMSGHTLTTCLKAKLEKTGADDVKRTVEHLENLFRGSGDEPVYMHMVKLKVTCGQPNGQYEAISRAILNKNSPFTAELKIDKLVQDIVCGQHLPTVTLKLGGKLGGKYIKAKLTGEGEVRVIPRVDVDSTIALVDLSHEEDNGIERPLQLQEGQYAISLWHELTDRRSKETALLTVKPHDAGALCQQKVKIS